MTSAQRTVEEGPGADTDAKAESEGWRERVPETGRWGLVVQSFCAGVVSTGLVLEVARLLDFVPILVNYSTIIIVLTTVVALLAKRLG